MVDMDRVLTKLERGLYVGVGTFGSTFVGNLMEDQVPGGDMGVAFGTAAVGLGISVGADEFIRNRSSMPNDLVEFAGYGVMGAAAAEIADEIQTGQSQGTRVSVGEPVRDYSSRRTPVREGSSSQSHGSSGQSQQKEFKLESA